MVVAVVGQAALQSLAQSVEGGPFLRERFECGIVEVEVELGIDFTATDVAGNELIRAVGFPNLVHMVIACSTNFLGEQTRKIHWDVLGCIVTEAVEIIFCDPHQGAIAHEFCDGIVTKFEGRHEGVEPSRQAFLVPKLGIESSVCRVFVGGPIWMFLVHRV